MRDVMRSTKSRETILNGSPLLGTELFCFHFEQILGRRNRLALSLWDDLACKNGDCSRDTSGGHAGGRCVFAFAFCLCFRLVYIALAGGGKKLLLYGKGPMSLWEGR